MCPSWILGNDYLYHSLEKCLVHPMLSHLIHPNQLLPQLLPTSDLVTRFQTKFSLSTSCSVSCVSLCCPKWILYSKKWIDLWVYVVGFIFFLICCVCISHSSLFNQKGVSNWLCLLWKPEKKLFQDYSFANIDWPWNHLKSPTLCHVNI